LLIPNRRETGKAVALNRGNTNRLPRSTNPRPTERIEPQTGNQFAVPIKMLDVNIPCAEASVGSVLGSTLHKEVRIKSGKEDG